MGSAPSKMSAGPPAASLTSDNDNNDTMPEMPEMPQTSHAQRMRARPERPSVSIPGKPDMAALRAKVAMSARSKPKGKKEDKEDKEDGEISDDEPVIMPYAASQPPPPATSPPAVPPPPPLPQPRVTVSPSSAILRSTVVTISDDSGAISRSPLVASADPNADEERQWMETVRSLLDEGFAPEVLIRKGVPARYVAKACQDIVAGSKRDRADLWREFRDPVPSSSATPSIAGEASTAPSRTRSPHTRSSSPDVVVAVAMGRTSSESSTEALVERMSPPLSLAPKIVSSWTPITATEPSFARHPPQASSSGAIHLDSYRPLSRPSSTDPYPPPSSLPKKPRSRRNRDLDRSRETQQVDTLNYDEDGDSTMSAPARTSATSEPAQSTSRPNVPLPAHVLETRRRALESLRKKKVGTPTSAMSTPPPQAGPSRSVIEEAAELEREFMAGSTAEVPMDIDDEVEDGEIEDAPPPPPPPPVPAPRPEPSRVRSGLKRPHAEDLMDNNSRPTSLSRPAPAKRRAFGGLVRHNRLVLILDDDSDSDSDSESAPEVVPPVIVIPSPYDTSALLAAKDEAIARLKEQIAAKMLAAKNAALSRGATPSGTATPPAAAVAAAAKAADQVGVEGVADDVVEAAVLAAAAEQRSHPKKPHSERFRTNKLIPDDVDIDMEVVDDADAARSRAASPAKSIISDASTSASNFRPYSSFLSRYPQLGSAVTDVLPNLTLDSSSSESDSSTDGLTIDWPLVSSIVLTHRVQNDPSSSWCRSEAGGGRCADANCTDFHLERINPTDDDLVGYVQDILALQADNAKHRTNTEDLDASDITAALTAARSDLEAGAEKETDKETEKKKGKGKGKKKTRGAAAATGSVEDTPEGLVDLLALTARRLQAR